MTPSDLMFRADLMHGQRLLITGGGSGLGRVMTEAALLLGAKVYICGRRQTALTRTAEELNTLHGSAGSHVVPMACDIRDGDAVHTLIENIWCDGGALTGLVNNAAGNFISRTENLSIRGFDAVANTVFRGSFLVTLACGKRWLAAGARASVVSILTTWVWNGSAFAVPSAMSKAGVHAMTQSLAVEWGSRGVRLNAIAPGLFPTEGMSARLDPCGTSHDVATASPMGRAGRMTELANLAMFLLSPGADYLNGQTIAIDGGQYLASGGNFANLSSWSDEQWARAQDRIRSADRVERALRGAASNASVVVRAEGSP